VKLTTVAKIPNAVRYSETCNDFLRFPDVTVTSPPRLNDSLFNCVTYWHWRNWQVDRGASRRPGKLT